MRSLLDLGMFVGSGPAFKRPIAGQAMMGQFPSNADPRYVTLYAPDDDVHGALLTVIGSAHQSLAVAMYGFDDEALAAMIKRKMSDPNMFVQLSLDKSQAGGVHERDLLSRSQYPANLVAYGHSARGAIMHMKMAVVDGRYTVTGSTNWSDSGETKQDNQLTIIDDAAFAARARTKIDLVHATMQQQMDANPAHAKFLLERTIKG